MKKTTLAFSSKLIDELNGAIEKKMVSQKKKPSQLNIMFFFDNLSADIYSNDIGEITDVFFHYDIRHVESTLDKTTYSPSNMHSGSKQIIENKSAIDSLREQYYKTIRALLNQIIAFIKEGETFDEEGFISHLSLE